MSQGSWGGGPPGGSWGGQGGGYGPPGGAPPGGWGPPGGGSGGYGPPPDGGGFAPPPAGYPPGYSPPTGSGAVAWEDPGRGFFGRWWDTFKEQCFNPRAFSAAAAQNDNPWPSVTFAMTCGAFAGLLYGMFTALIYFALGSVIAAAGRGGGAGLGAGGPGAMIAIMGMIGAFAIVIYPMMFAMGGLIGPWISGGIYHLMLVMFKGATRPYSSTVRVCGYAHAANCWMVVPGLGGLVALVFQLVCVVVGLDETHKCGIGKAVAAVLVPFFLAICCCCGIYALVLAGASSSHF